MRFSPVHFAAQALALSAAVTAQAATVEALPLLPVPAGFELSYASVVAMNAAGDVVGTLGFREPDCGRYCPRDSLTRSFFVRAGSAEAQQVGPDGFFAVGLSNAGEVVGNSTRYWADLGLWANEPGAVLDGVYRPLSATPTTVSSISPGGRIYFGLRGNDYGIVAGLASDGEHATWTATWNARRVDVSLGLHCSQPSPLWACYTATTGYDSVQGLNNGRSVREAMTVGVDRQNPWSSSFGPQYAFVGWRGKLFYLHPPGGSQYDDSGAYAVNGRGTVVGHDLALMTPSDSSAAALWWHDGRGHWTLVSLAAQVQDPAWRLSRATAVNDAGWVAGHGVYGGQPRAFLIKP